MITLPLARVLRPSLRILTKRRWSDSNTNPRKSGGPWTVWPVSRPGNGDKTGPGFRVLSWERACLPVIGRARLAFRFGNIDRQIIGVTADSVARAHAGQAWDQTVDGTIAPDLNEYEVRIQAAPNGTEDFRTVWWGQVESQETRAWPAALFPSGERIYHCVDGLARASRWRLDRHGYAVSIGGSTQTLGRMHGHPGYNVQRGVSHFSRILGNRYSSQWSTEGGLTADYHTWAGSGTIPSGASKWTDRQAVEHGLVATRPSGEPWFQMLGYTDLLDGFAAWPVQEGETALEFTNKVCRRERGKGLVFVDWDDDSSDPTGDLTVCLRCRSPFADNITWFDPPTAGNLTITVPGTTIDVDLIGDHRVVDDSLGLSDKDQYRLDALESLGENIEVLGTMAYTDAPVGSYPHLGSASVIPRWSLADRTAFIALTTAIKRIEERWRPVYQLHGLPYTWDGTLGDGNNGSKIALSRGDYRCNNAGNIINPGDAVGATSPNEDVGYLTEPTSPALTAILPSIPLYDGYRYDVTVPVRWDGAAESGDASRRPLLVMVRIASDKYVKVSELGGSFSYCVDDDGIRLGESTDDGVGTRYFSDTTAAGVAAGLVAAFKYTDLVFTVAVRLPHRVRMYTGLNPANPECRRRLAIIHSNLHLWLAHPGAIWDLDATSGTATTGHPAKRQAANASSASPGLLRDDRSDLARLHALAWAWYGESRRAASWAIRDCGFLPSFQAYREENPDFSADPTTVTYPTLGEIVATLACNGQTEDIGTPVTRIIYDDEAGVTKWETDWSSLEFVGNE